MASVGVVGLPLLGESPFQYMAHQLADGKSNSIHGTPREIHAEARRLYDLLGAPSGGFVGYVEEYGVMGMSGENYRACAQAFRQLCCVTA